MPSRPRKCCICPNYAGNMIDGRKVSMHRFPANQKAFKIWVSRCKNAKPKFVYATNNQTRLCNRHFIGRQGPTKEHPLPVIFPKPDGTEKTFKLSMLDEGPDIDSDIVNMIVDPDAESLLQSVEDGSHPSIKVEPDAVSMYVEEHNQVDVHTDKEEPCGLIMDASDTEPYSEPCGLVMEADDTVFDISLKLHNYTGMIPTQPRTKEMALQTEPTTCSISTQTEEPEIINFYNTASQTPIVNHRNRGIQINAPSLTFDDICYSDNKVMFYTGIPSAAKFRCLFNKVKDGMEKDNDKGRPRSLRIIDEFFMVLMRLRLGLRLEDLADRFRISVSSASTIFKRWIDHLNTSLEGLVKWPTRENIDLNMPLQFKGKYPNCRVVIACAEIKSETPNYKSHMTYKSLIGISPDGIVTFVSDLYAGSTSDEQLTILSGLVDKCEKGDAIMVDKDFLISDVTTPRGIHLIIPPFKGKTPLLPHEVEATKTITNLRIHVERQMERIKNFRIVQGVVPINMATQISKIWKTCVRLTALQPPLVSNGSSCDN